MKAIKWDSVLATLEDFISSFATISRETSKIEIVRLGYYIIKAPENLAGLSASRALWG
ncbi:MAG: hypothetical protein QW266_06690 [Sulfolobales archaeon]